MLEGKEVSVNIDNGAGEVFVDVNDKGGVELGIVYKKEIDLDGYAEVSADVGIKGKTDIFKIASKIAAKTSTPVDDAFVQGLKNLLGIKD